LGGIFRGIFGSGLGWGWVGVGELLTRNAWGDAQGDA
jgi:hypothetical protein